MLIKDDDRSVSCQKTRIGTFTFAFPEEKWLKLEKNWLSAPAWLKTLLKWVEHRSRHSLLNSRKGTRHGCRVTGQTVFRSVASMVLLQVTFCKTWNWMLFPIPRWEILFLPKQSPETCCPCQKLQSALKIVWNPRFSLRLWLIWQPRQFLVTKFTKWVNVFLNNIQWIYKLHFI